jgi:hypothetical protein
MSFRKYGGLQYAAKYNTVSSNYNTANNLLVTQNVGQPNSYITFLSDISGDITIYGNLDVSGNEIITGNLDVQGNLDVSGNEIIGGNLDVHGNLDVSGNEIIGENLNVHGNLDVSGNANFNNDILVNTITVGRGGKGVQTNTALGFQALYSNTTGSNNVANGFQSLQNNTTGNSNVANGFQALYSNTTGVNNTALGFQALYSNTTGYNNTAVGLHVLFSNTTGYQNVAIGQSALLSNTVGNNNVATGYSALQFNTTGSQNVANGLEALYSNTSGNSNTALGHQALRTNTTGTGNTALGYQALYSDISGNYNVAIGQGALFSNTTGIQNVANGYNALYFNTGPNNTAIGSSALYNNTTGNCNTAIGVNAGENAGVNVGCTFLGCFTDISSALPCNISTAVGYGAKITTSNQIVLGTDVDTVYIPGILDVSGTYLISALGVKNNTTLSTATVGTLDVSNNNVGGTLDVKGTTTLSTATVGTLGVTGNTTVTGTLGVTGNTTLSTANLTGTLGVTGNTTLSTANLTGTLGVTGNATVGGTLGVTGNATVGGTLGVTGNTTLSTANLTGTLGVTGKTTTGTLGVTGNATVGGTLGVTGNTTVSGTLGVTGNTTLSTANLTGTLGVTGNTTTASLGVTSNATVGGTLGVTSNATVGGTLGVTGNTTLSTANLTGTLGVTGNTTLSTATITGTLGVTSNATVGGTLNVSNSVGIGTTNPACSLDVNGIFRCRNVSYLFPDTGISIPSSTTANQLSFGFCGGNYDTNSGECDFFSTWDPTNNNVPAFNFYKYISATPTLLVSFLNSGTLQIGTPASNPATGKLTIYEPIGTGPYTQSGSTLTYASGTSGTSGSLVISHNSGGCSSIVFPSKSNYGGGDCGYIQYFDNVGTNTSESGLLLIGIENDATSAAVAGPDRIVLYPCKGTGYVGINNLNPAYSLDVSGNTHVTGNSIVTGTLTLGTNNPSSINYQNGNVTQATSGLSTFSTSAVFTDNLFPNPSTQGAIYQRYIGAQTGAAGSYGRIINGFQTIYENSTGTNFYNNVALSKNLYVTGLVEAASLDVTDKLNNIIKIIPNATAGSNFNPIVETGTEVISSYGNSINTSSLVLTTWSTKCSGLRITPNFVVLGCGGTTNTPSNNITISGTDNKISITSTQLSVTSNTNITGNMTVTGTVQAASFNATSDYRIKENIKPLDSTFTIDSLNPVTYFNKQLEKQDVGLIAHELQEVYPFLVTGEKDGESNQSVNYNGLIGILIKEIQDLKERVKILENN